MKVKNNLHYLSAAKRRDMVYFIVNSLQDIKELVNDAAFDPRLYWEIQHIEESMLDKIFTLANLYD